MFYIKDKWIIFYIGSKIVFYLKDKRDNNQRTSWNSRVRE